MRPSDVGISNADAPDALICSRDIRGHYSSTSPLWDVGGPKAARK